VNIVYKIYQLLFINGTYNRRLWLHLLILFFTSVFFISIYFVLGTRGYQEDIRSYYQLILSRALLLAMVVHLILVVSIKWPSMLTLLREYFTEKGSAFNLAIFRIIFFGILGGHFLFYCSKIQISWAYLPYASRVELPFIGWFIQAIPISPEIYLLSSIIAGLLSLLVCVGLFGRFAVIALLPFAFYSLGVPMFYGKISHYHILFWIPLIFCFSPMNDRISLDNLIKGKLGRAPKTEFKAQYMLPFKLLWIQLAIIYLFAGVIKLWDNGLDWALSDSMIFQMQLEWVENYDKAPRFRIDHYPWLAKLGGLMVIYFELLYFLLILKPKGRIWAFIGAFSFHKIAGYFMYIDFENLRMIHLSYLNFDFFIQRLKSQKNGLRGIVNENKREFEDIRIFFKSKLTKFTFGIGLTVVVINFIFSLTKTHSYPFSSYPTYSAIVKNELPIIRMDVFDSQNNMMDVKKIGQKNKFRWENIRPYELRISKMYEDHDTLAIKPKLEEYWLLWRNNNPELMEALVVDMYLEVTELAPEKRNIILKSSYLGRVYPQELNK